MATTEVNATAGSSLADGGNKPSNENNKKPTRNNTTPPQHHQHHQHHQQQHTLVTPTSPPYPPYGATYIDPAQLAASGYDMSEFTTAYVYPLSPQFSVQYYNTVDYGSNGGGGGYQSYPGSPALHPQSPPMNPSSVASTSPPFSPTFSYQQGGLTLSPPTHAAYMLPPHHAGAQPFPPLHISSPVLTGTNSIPGSPPLPHHQYHLPGPYIIATAAPAPHHHHPSQQNDHQHQHNNNSNHHRNNNNSNTKRQQQHNSELHHQQQLQLQQQLEAEANSFHTHNIYVRGLSPTTTDESFLEMCQV